MKKISSFILTALLLCTFFCICANAAEEKIVIYDLSPVNGEIPYGAGKVSDCYYPNPDGSNPYDRPEIYTYTNSKVELQDGFFKLIPTSANATLFFDTAPTGYDITKWGTDKYVSFVVKSEKATTGEVILRTHSNKFQISFPIEFTGDWQRIVANVSKDAGWMTKDASGKYTVPTECDHGGILKFYLPGQNNTGYYLFDYYGYFSNISSAKKYTVNVTDAVTTVLGMGDEPTTVEVTFDANGGAWGEETKKIVDANVGEIVTAPEEAPARTGYTFKGWSPELATVTAYGATYTAIWEPNERIVIYDLSPVDGEIPFGAGKVSDCYYPNPDGSNPYDRPEIYTYTNSKVELQDGFFKLIPTSANATLFFDTAPTGYDITKWGTDKYVSFVVKSEKATTGEVILRTHSNKFQISFPIEFTGDWQRIVANVSKDAGWMTKDASGKYTVPTECDHGGILKFYLPGQNNTGYYLFDYYGYFSNISSAKKYTVNVTDAVTTVLGMGDEPTTVEVTFDANGGAWGEETKKVVDATIGEIVTAPEEAPARVGYTFKGWSPELAAVTAYGATYKATWEANEYDVIFDAGDGLFDDGKNTKTVKTTFGAAITAPEDPKLEGYIFIGWTPEVSVLTTEGATFVAEYEVDVPKEVTISVNIVFDRGAGSKPYTSNFAKLFIYKDDTKQELLIEQVIEDENTADSEVAVEIDILEGTYYAEIIKNGYLTYKTEVIVTEERLFIGEINLVPGDIKGDIAEPCGDGKIDIDDFVRVLRGFSEGASDDLKSAVDINEDGTVNVLDLAFIKTNFGKVSE